MYGQNPRPPSEAKLETWQIEAIDREKNRTRDINDVLLAVDRVERKVDLLLRSVGVLS